MAADILNTQGTTTGYQKINGIAVNTGGITPKISTTHPSGLILISSITGQYDARFDDPTYY